MLSAETELDMDKVHFQRLDMTKYRCSNAQNKLFQKSSCLSALPQANTRDKAYVERMVKVCIGGQRRRIIAPARKTALGRERRSNLGAKIDP